jgi:hypothetical protein
LPSGATDVVEVVQRVDLPGRPDVEIPVGAVRAADERRVDTRVGGGLDVGLVVADEQHGVGVEVGERPVDGVGVRFPEVEALDRVLAAVGRVEQPRDLEVVEEEVDRLLLVRTDDASGDVEVGQRVDVLGGYDKAYRRRAAQRSSVSTRAIG